MLNNRKERETSDERCEKCGCVQMPHTNSDDENEQIVNDCTDV